MAQIQVTLVRSLNGRPQDQRGTVRALGLRKMHSVAVHEDTPSVRGMVRKVRHLIRVDEVTPEIAAAPEPDAAAVEPIAETEDSESAEAETE